MVNNDTFSKRYALASFLGALLGILVVTLGAYTRLADAGLGCPDWPGCYGQLIGVPHSHAELAHAAALYPHQPVEASKAWPEMIHRYVAGFLGLLILSLSLLSGLRSIKRRFVPGLNLNGLLGVVLACQVILGLWTVTMKLHPLVIMSHLMGGMTITVLLWGLSLCHRDHASAGKVHTPIPVLYARLVLGCVGMIVIQILLGGWTSANYASIICTDFPTCHGQWWPDGMHFSKAFNFLAPLGINYQGGVLGDGARVAIQMVHRYWGMLTASACVGTALMMVFSRHMPSRLKYLAWGCLAAMCLQVLLGILNIRWLLPMWVAVSHNGMALIVLLLWVTLLYCLRQTQRPVSTKT